MSNTTKQVKEEYFIVQKEFGQILINALEVYYQYLENHIDEMNDDELEEYGYEMVNLTTLLEIINQQNKL